MSTRHALILVKKIAVVLGILTFLSGGAAFAERVDLRGEITVHPALQHNFTKIGALYVYVYQYDPDLADVRNIKSPPLAFWRELTPRFPQAFRFTEAHLRTDGKPLEGKLLVVAKYAPSGHAIQKQGSIYGLDSRYDYIETTQAQNIQIELNLPLD